MTKLAPSPVMTVRLRESTVALLMGRRASPDETLDAVVARLAAAPAPAPATPYSLRKTTARTAPSKLPSGHGNGKYALLMLGEALHAKTLGEMFARVVDTLADIDPAAIERLAKMRSTKRAFIARDRMDIHPKRPDLPTLCCATGWWVSANMGTEDLKRALRALCEASNLIYDSDIRLLG